MVIFLGNIKGLGTENTGLIIGLTPILVLPFILAWGNIIDKTKKIIKYLSLLHLFSAILTVLMLFTNSFAILFILTLIKNIIILPGNSLSDEYLMFLVNKGRLSFGKIRLFGTVGYALSGLIGPLISVLAGIEGCIVFGAVLTFISVFIYRKMPEIILEEKALHQAEAEEKSNLFKNAFALFKNQHFVSILVITASIMGAITAASTYGNQAVLLGLNCPDAIIASLPFSLVFLETILLRVMDQVSFRGKEYRFYLLAAILCVFRWIVVITTGSYLAVVAVCSIHGLTSGVVLPIQNKMVGDSVKDSQRSTAYLLVAVTSFTIVPSIINLITSRLSGIFPIGIFGIVYLIVTIPGLLLVIKNLRKSK